MDKLTPEERSKLMSKVHGKNTKPERLVRSMLHRAGYRFSLHRKDLPGKPDVTLRKYKTVVFVHGCFWHRHEGCKKTTMPQSNVDFWRTKFERNVANDRKHRVELERLGWKVLVVWECELKRPEEVLERLRRELTLPETGAYSEARDPLPLAAEAGTPYYAKGKTK